MLDFAGANTERQRPEGPVGGSVAVAANDGLPRLRNAQLGPDDVHDALMLAVHVKKPHTGFTAIFLERLKLQACVRVDDGESAVGRRDGVVHHREGEIRAADFASLSSEAGERLRRSAFVDEVAVDIDQRGLPWLFVDNVTVPNLLVQSLRSAHSGVDWILAL
jgi:hypothetical protein